jgi:REP element-mobilizing transposase RayT
MNSEISISKMVQLLKGESSFWANQEKLVKPKLEWAKDYYAVSISNSVVPRVREYIRNQDKKHDSGTFQEDYQQFIKDYKF